MKKIIALILTFMMVISLAATAVSAEPSWKISGGKHTPPGIVKKLFQDSDEIEWARKAIEKLYLKGLVRGWNGMFFPKNPVTSIEAVVMALRIMDWEEEALSVNELPKKYRGGQVQKWAVGYVTVAYEKGILDDVDMMYFNPNAPAKRHEVAKYVVRALGKDDEAQDHMDEDLPFKDAAAVPQGSVGYVYLVNELGIMTGDGKNFNPMGTLTRAEMAVLFSNLDDKVDGDADENEYRGIVQDIDDDEIVLRIGSTNKTFKVSDDVLVYEGRIIADYSDISIGSKVVVQTEDGEAVYIEILDTDDSSDKIISRYTGELVDIQEGDPSTITVQADKMKIIFEVLDDVEVYFKGDEGKFDELEEGDEVTVTVDNRNRARRIYVYREREGQDEEEARGMLTDIDLTGSYHISVNNQVYELSEDAAVKIEGDNAELEDLIIGMWVEAVIEDGIVTTIHAEDYRYEVEGKIEDITKSSGVYWIELDIGDETKTYKVDSNVDITIEGIDDADIYDLEEGQEGKFEIVNSTIVEIDIED